MASDMKLVAKKSTFRISIKIGRHEWTLFKYARFMRIRDILAN